MNPSKSEKEHWNRVSALGCIACLQDGIFNDYVSIHHCDGRTKPGAHKKVLALCSSHHQTGGQEAPAIHPYKARFEKKYGTQFELMEKTAKLLAAS